MEPNGGGSTVRKHYIYMVPMETLGTNAGTAKALPFWIQREEPNHAFLPRKQPNVYDRVIGITVRRLEFPGMARVINGLVWDGIVGPIQVGECGVRLVFVYTIISINPSVHLVPILLLYLPLVFRRPNSIGTFGRNSRYDRQDPKSWIP